MDRGAYRNARPDVFSLVPVLVISVGILLLWLIYRIGLLIDAPAEERQLLAGREAEEKEQQITTTRHAEEAREGRYRALCLRYSTQTLYDDPEYVRRLAVQHAKKLISKKEEILRDYLGLHQDPSLISMMQRSSPEIYRRMTVPLELLRIAERAAIFGTEPNLVHYEAMDIYEDESFVEEYAERHRSQLLSERRRIITEYETLHQDQAFIARLKRERPEIYKRATWEIRALNGAERLDAKWRADPKVPDEPKQKRPLTEQDIRQEMVRKEENRVEDRLARANVLVRAHQRVRDIVSAYRELSDEEKAEAEKILKDAIEENGGSPGRVV